MEIFKLFGSIMVDNAEADKSISKTEGKAEGLASKFGSGIKTAAKWGAAIAAGAAGAAVAVGAMAAPLVRAAADAQAMQAQFDQVFAELGQSATDSLSKIAEETGMLPNRLKGSFTAMAAFAKTTGMDTADALALTERATLAAADSAAFYDRSIEDVSESLQSFLKGNYANDAALGISATETTRNAAANDLYGKSFKDLDEAQKQLTLLKMVEEGNKLSGAFGQAALESDAFENQLGNLKQAWEDMKAKFGAPILEPAVKGIQALSEAMMNVDTDAIIAGFEKFIGFIQNNVIGGIKTAKDTVMAFYDAFMSVFYDTGEAGDVLAKIGISPETAEKIESFFRGIIDGFTSLRDNMMPFFDTLKGAFQDFVDSLGPLWEALKDLFKSLEPILGAVAVLLGGVLVTAFGVVISTISAVISAIGPLLTAILNIADFVTNMVIAVVALLTGDFAGAWEYIKKAGESAKDFFVNIFKTIVNFISTFVKTIVDFFHGLYMTLVGNSIIPDMVNEILDWFKDMFKWVVDVVKDIVDGVKAGFELMKKNVEAALEAAKKIIAAVLDYWKKTFENVLKFLSSLVKGDFEGMKNAIKAQMDNASQLILNIWNSIKAFFSTVLGDILVTVARKFTDMIQSVRGKMDDVFSAIRNIWDKVTGFFGGIDLYEIGRNILQGLINGVVSMTRNVIDSVKGVVDSAIEGAKNLLGIKSPSRVFMDIGDDTGQGFVNGLRAMANKVSQASDYMVRAAIPDVPSYGVGTVTRGTTAGAHASSGAVVNQVVNIHSPQHLSPSETARLQKRAAQELALGW